VHGELKTAFSGQKQRLSHARVNASIGTGPRGATAPRGAQEIVRLLAPSTRCVDRHRFECSGVAYRFEAYTRRPKEVGYYALPLLGRDRVIGWGTSR